MFTQNFRVLLFLFCSSFLDFAHQLGIIGSLPYFLLVFFVLLFLFFDVGDWTQGLPLARQWSITELRLQLFIILFFIF
jgi:hypothetical protein